jgi:hypothetical protein
MNSSHLEYSSPTTPRGGYRLPWRTMGAVAVLLLLASAMLSVTVRHVSTDRATGSSTRQTDWIWGIHSSVRVDVSPLETHLTRSGIAWTASNQFCNDTGYSLLGVNERSCGTAPPINYLRPVRQHFVAASSDAELREFVQVMQNGAEQQQRDAVDAAAEKAFAAMGAAPAGR